MADVRFDQVGKSYGDASVIENLSLHVQDQEFMVFVGPSGCGKSTALRMIAGLETVSSGSLSIGGRVVNDEPPKARDCAMVFQSYALYPHMTVRENIAFGLKIRRVDPAEINRRVEAAADTLSLGPCLDRKPKALSGGQRQRVALGRALVRQPSVFLFDEPLSNLDAELRVVMRAEIARLQSELKTTTVYVTHDQVEAMTLGHRIAVLAPLARGGGRNLMQVGAPLELYNEPQNVFVARFLGTPNMNLVTMTMEEDGRTARFNDAHFLLPEKYRLGALARPDSELVVGFRPEHASADPNSDWANAARLRGSVEIIETLGHEIILHLRCGGEKILAKTKDATSGIRLGDTIDVAVDVSRLHVFDPKTEARLPYRSACSAAA